MPRICVFDVNETLLDFHALDPYFQRVFGTAAVRQDWFNQLLQSALVTIVTDSYTDFGMIGGAALDMVAARYDINLSAEDRQQILGGTRPCRRILRSPKALRAYGMLGCAWPHSRIQPNRSLARN